jgi:triphosphoribosyl-dephospho-CoA synthase
MMDIATSATLACIWEATAAKPGNVYRGGDFEDVTYADFLTSAVVLGPKLALVPARGVGYAILESIRAIHNAVGTNTYLGTVLLLAPLAAVPADVPLNVGLPKVLEGLTTDDTRLVYEAIRLAQPGGLGKVDEADVHEAAPDITLVEAMGLAANRDLVARQFTNGFEQVFWAAARIREHGLPLSNSIVRGYLELLAEYPDTLVARKCGMEMAQEVSRYAARILTYTDEGYNAAVADFDFWLRADGHRRNPGTSADIILAALFVLLRDGKLEWPVRFY